MSNSDEKNKCPFAGVKENTLGRGLLYHFDRGGLVQAYMWLCTTVRYNSRLGL